MRVLILRLDGPLMSFGDVAIDEIRPTRRLPARSMLAGLLANALGCDHREVEALARLQDRLRFAARLDQPGRTIVDYQTAYLNQHDPLWTTWGAPGKRKGGGLTWDKNGFGTVERWRHYLADALVTVALTLRPADEKPDLNALAAALRRPERPLFLGRKGCPPARPLWDGSVEADSLVDALKLVPVLPRCSRSEPTPSDMLVETEDAPEEPEGRRVVEVADRRDWRLGFHAGLGHRRELRARLQEVP